MLASFGAHRAGSVPQLRLPSLQEQRLRCASLEQENAVLRRRAGAASPELSGDSDEIRGLHRALEASLAELRCLRSAADQNRRTMHSLPPAERANVRRLQLTVEDLAARLRASQAERATLQHGLRDREQEVSALTDKVAELMRGHARLIARGGVPSVHREVQVDDEETLAAVDLLESSNSRLERQVAELREQLELAMRGQSRVQRSAHDRLREAQAKVRRGRGGHEVGRPRTTPRCAECAASDAVP